MGAATHKPIASWDEEEPLRAGTLSLVLWCLAASQRMLSSLSLCLHSFWIAKIEVENVVYGIFWCCPFIEEIAGSWTRTVLFRQYNPDFTVKPKPYRWRIKVDSFIAFYV